MQEKRPATIYTVTDGRINTIKGKDANDSVFALSISNAKHHEVSSLAVDVLKGVFRFAAERARNVEREEL